MLQDQGCDKDRKTLVTYVADILSQTPYDKDISLGEVEEEGTMLSLSHVEEQLKRVGCNFRFWGRPEIRELCNILVPGEVVAQCVNGRYEGGFALLVVTDHRLLLIDKKPMFLTLEDVRFDMIAEIDFSAQLFESTVRIVTPTRKLVFHAWNQMRLRTLLNYVQRRMMEIRQHYSMQQQFQQQPAQGQQQAYGYAPQADRHEQIALVGEMAVQGNYQTMLNPYNKVPVLMRRRRYPRFY